mmetsp:Transcript_16138/g.37173  ORF Transcript_16138/g.37173 Transcript_16138/m.37173 type:complete len:283 (-) Transcript_16138:133-981(-)
MQSIRPVFARFVPFRYCTTVWIHVPAFPSTVNNQKPPGNVSRLHILVPNVGGCCVFCFTMALLLSFSPVPVSTKPPFVASVWLLAGLTPNEATLMSGNTVPYRTVLIIIVLLFLRCLLLLLLLLLVLLEIHEQFVCPVNLGLQVKASPLADVVGLEVFFELLLHDFRIGFDLFLGEVEDHERLAPGNGLSKDGRRRLVGVDSGLAGVVECLSVGGGDRPGQHGDHRDGDLGQDAGKGADGQFGGEGPRVGTGAEAHGCSFSFCTCSSCSCSSCSSCGCSCYK